MQGVNFKFFIFLNNLNGQSPCPGLSTIKDIDGNSYNTILIGKQCWLKENLKVSKYRNGEDIPTGLDDNAWYYTNKGAYAIYNNNNANNAIYGKLYNWYAVSDSRGLCPSGWHVPSDSEWTTLTNYLGGESVAGGKMKSTGTTLWLSPNAKATNESSFSVLPGGCRAYDGRFSNISRDFAFFWSATETDSNGAMNRSLVNSEITVMSLSATKSVGASVRCLRD